MNSDVVCRGILNDVDFIGFFSGTYLETAMVIPECTPPSIAMKHLLDACLVTLGFLSAQAMASLEAKGSNGVLALHTESEPAPPSAVKKAVAAGCADVAVSSAVPFADSLPVARTVERFAQSAIYALERAFDGTQAKVEMGTLGIEEIFAKSSDEMTGNIIDAEMMLAVAGDEISPKVAPSSTAGVRLLYTSTLQVRTPPSRKDARP